MRAVGFAKYDRVEAHVWLHLFYSEKKKVTNLRIAPLLGENFLDRLRW